MAHLTPAERAAQREKTADRLLRSATEHFYDADVDIDWSAPVEPDKYWLAEHRISLYGTRLWQRLSPEQRVELGRHELVSLLSFGIYVEGILTTILVRIVGHGPVTSKHSLYALTEIGEEARHSTMFARLIDKTGVPAYPEPWLLRVVGKVAQLIPLGPVVYGGTLLVEEVLDRGQREHMHDPGVQPHVRQLMRIHVLEEARHISYARGELRRGMAKRGRLARAYHRGTLALGAFVIYPMLINPGVYRSVGINPVRGFLAAQFNPRNRASRREMSEQMVAFLADNGMLEGPITTRLWRAAGAI